MMRRQLSPVLPPVEQSLEGIKRVQVIAFGKAAIPMLDALLSRLPEKLRVDGICSSPEPPARAHKHIRYYQGSHPLPNEDSVAAAKAALDLLRKAGRETFVFFSNLRRRFGCPGTAARSCDSAGRCTRFLRGTGALRRRYRRNQHGSQALLRRQGAVDWEPRRRWPRNSRSCWPTYR